MSIYKSLLFGFITIPETQGTNGSWSTPPQILKDIITSIHVASHRSVSSWWMHFFFLIGRSGMGSCDNFSKCHLSKSIPPEKNRWRFTPMYWLIMAPKTNRHRTWEWRCAIYFRYRVVWANFHLGAEKKKQMLTWSLVGWFWEANYSTWYVDICGWHLFDALIPQKRCALRMSSPKE